jgi:hypothetical protein
VLNVFIHYALLVLASDGPGCKGGAKDFFCGAFPGRRNPRAAS